MKEGGGVDWPRMVEDRLQAEERRLWLVVGLSMAGAAVFLYLRTFLAGGVPLVVGDDQVLFFVRAARMAPGQVPYRDFFELVTPGTELMYAVGFRVFGVHAWVMAAWGVVLGVALVGVTAHISGRILRGWLVWLPGLLFMVFDYDVALDATTPLVQHAGGDGGGERVDGWRESAADGWGGRADGCGYAVYADGGGSGVFWGDGLAGVAGAS